MDVVRMSKGGATVVPGEGRYAADAAAGGQAQALEEDTHSVGRRGARFRHAHHAERMRLVPARVPVPREENQVHVRAPSGDEGAGGAQQGHRVAQGTQ
jgi:hypothetical protein